MSLESIIEEPTLIENILYYGLLVGAFFQLACIFAVVYIPQSENEEEMPDEPEADSKPSAQSSQSGTSRSRGKKEKKKHR